MKRRLFWKILAAFWLTFLAITLAVSVLLDLNRNRTEGPGAQMARDMGDMALVAGAQALAADGPQGLDRLRSQLPARQRQGLALATQAVPPTDLGTVQHRQVTGPDGRSYTLIWRQANTGGPPPGGILRIPPELLVLGTLGGLAFSAALAWYLIAPIARLRAGFDRLARGDLEVRLTPAIGRRRDEIADLGRDFDIMAQRLEQLVSARDRLLHDVSHELRSPLARLQLAIGLARQDPSRTELTLHRIEREARRLEQLVDELLALARAEHGQQAGEEYFDLAAIVQGVSEDASFEAEANGVRIQLATDMPGEDERPLMTGNAELIHRAIDNIMRNALRFSSPGHAVEVSVRLDQPAARWQVEIADSGPGVAQADIAMIFDPFVRGESAGSGSGSGLGLGLSIASRAVMAHGGSVTARNRASGGDGGGLAVTVLLPVNGLPR